MKTLIIGGARSGKSRYAEDLATASGKRVVYIATAQAGDAEMSQRIEHHRTRRDAAWTTVEEPIALAAGIERNMRADRIVLVDCLTLWLSNLLHSESGDYPDLGPVTPPALVESQITALLQVLRHANGDLILVTNEVGQGIVPSNATARWFVDEAGRTNQAVAACCERAVLMVAGMPLALKG